MPFLKKQIAFLLSMSLLLVLSVSCKKGYDRHHPTVFLPQELKRYVLFKKDSYWVYQDSATNALDSVVVTSDTTFISKFYDEEINAITNVQENAVVKTYSYADSHWYTYLIHSRCLMDYPPTDYPCYLLERSEAIFDTTDLNGVWRVAFIYFPKIGTEAYPGYSRNVKVSAFYQSLQVGGISYSEVVRMDDNYNLIENNLPTRFYYAKDYGLIRKEIVGPEGVNVWNLVRSNLYQ